MCFDIKKFIFAIEIDEPFSLSCIVMKFSMLVYVVREIVVEELAANKLRKYVYVCGAIANRDEELESSV
jgi:hypothetical protein